MLWVFIRVNDKQVEIQGKRDKNRGILLKGSLERP